MTCCLPHRPGSRTGVYQDSVPRRLLARSFIAAVRHRCGQGAGHATGRTQPVSRVDRPRADTQYRAPPAGSRSCGESAWNPVTDDYQRNCSPLGMPGAMMSPHPIEFAEQGDDIILRLEEWDALRTIHLREETASAVRPASRMGYSVGRWDGSTLAVDTTGINYPYLDEYGTPQSDSVEVVESFTLSADGRHLDWSATVTDPRNFTEPFVISTTRWEWLPGETLQAYNCAETDDLLEP